MRDWRGLEVTGASAATLTAINDFSEGFLAYQTRAANVLAAADGQPDCPLAQACAALLHMFSETAAAPARAQPYIERAVARAERVTPRERAVIEVARAWVSGDVARAIAVGEQAADEYPRDLALAKATQYHLFNLGRSAAMLRVGHLARRANADVAYAHGMIAFGYEQCHWLAEAEAAARRALALRADEPWAQHALAHVMLTQGRDAEARSFLEEAKPGWSALNSFMHTHNWWHLALVQIEQGEADRVLAYYDQHIWGVWKTYSQDQIGAVSLLARLELAGVTVGARWSGDLAEHLAARVHDHVQPFLSMHYLYGLARADRPEADAMLRSIHAAAANASAISRAAWAEVCVPACEGLLAHARGRWAACIDRLGPVLPRMAEIGGSHAQRDLFEQILTDALMRDGRWEAAQQRLEPRRAGNPHSVPTRHRLARTYHRLGLPEEAALTQPYQEATRWETCR